MNCKVAIYVGEIVGCWCCGCVSVAVLYAYAGAVLGLVW